MPASLIMALYYSIYNFSSNAIMALYEQITLGLSLAP